MKHSRHFWRGLFFILLITALCGGMVLPAGSVRAAPASQVVCSLVMAQWTFDNLASAPNSSPGYSSIASDVVKATSTAGSGLTSPTISASPKGWYASSFAAGATLDIANNDFFQFEIDTMNYSGVNLSFNALRSGQGPLSMQVYYSIDGTNFNALAGTYAIDIAYPASPFTADLTGLTNMAGSTYIRIYGWNAGGAGGTGRVDDVTFNGCQPATPTPTPTDTGTPTNTGTPTSTPTATGTPTSTGTPTPTGSATSTGTPTFTPTITNTPATGSATNVVISEFRTTGPNGGDDEFIEIYNPTANWIDISGWIISGSNSSGTVQNRATIPTAIILRSGQYYLVAHNNYINTSLPPNLRYGTSIANDGGIALLDPAGQIIDEVGMHQDSFYQEGDTLSPLSGNTNQSYEREAGGSSDSCVDTNNNDSDFSTSSSNTLHNYSSPLSLCGTLRPSLGTTTTLITADTPDPSLVNENVTVSVSVTGGSTTPTGKVNITGANTNCTIANLNAAGAGSCIVKFTSTGTKTLIATYLGDNTHAASSGSQLHQVTTSSGTGRTPTPTPRPTLAAPPPLIGINEFVPRPGHDWNNDGAINVGDEYIELINHGVIDVNLSSYTLDDEVNIGSAPFTLPSITLKPGERHVFYGSETRLLLSDGGDGVRLLRLGQLTDAYNYSVVRFPDQSYCRIPDNGGLDDWNQTCFPTPGLQNSLSGITVNPPTSGDAENLCPIADTLPRDFVLAECPAFGNNIWNSAYWDRFGWFNERYLPESSGKWNVFVD